MFADGLFILFTVIAVTGAAGLVLFKHPMNGAMSFIVTLIAMAGLYALLSAKLIFAIQLIVYAGAIMSLILFIIMFLNIQEEDLPVEEGRFKYLIGGAIIVAPIGLFLTRVIKSFPGAETTITVEGFGGIKEVGLILFREWLLPFEIVSILLLVSLVGAVVLAGKRRMVK
ncbi:NADH-quinone oxidoreductase subunit J [Desulfogranum marinum]|uniref:NADH-quinone oxidoreductase subunit J family protein n=1 Tax=Desulfogranum marinum TaxID=453220 RepID=UPI0029C95E6E|nr:NADH-quinone oxidoreductase subunit J [Desulfogranum marinum]